MCVSGLGISTSTNRVADMVGPRPDNGIPNDDGFDSDIAVGGMSRARWETWVTT